MVEHYTGRTHCTNLVDQSCGDDEFMIYDVDFVASNSNYLAIVDCSMYYYSI